jgi:hypothetical protein
MCAVFLLFLMGLLFLLVAPFPHPWVSRKTPKLGVKKKRITLDADFTLLTDVISHRLIQPVPALLKQFLLFSAWLWGKPRKYLLRQPMFQKNQFAAPAHCCFCCAAVDTSCFYYGFYWFLLLLY